MLPSRDMLVRKAAPPGAAGRVFGIVATGFNIGGIVGPLVFGWIMDHGAPVVGVRHRGGPAAGDLAVRLHQRAARREGR